MQKTKFIVVGGGLSGLATALTLHQSGKDVLLLEASPRVGGVVRSISCDGYLCELGPQILSISDPGARVFLRTHALADNAIYASPQSRRRFLVKDNRLVSVPRSPSDLWRSRIVSEKAKWRLLMEPLISRGSAMDESVAGFFARRLGNEVQQELVSPMISGIYAGDPEQIILRHAFPKLFRMEQEYGSLLWGALREGSGAMGRGEMISWPGGLSELPRSIASRLGDRVRLETAVERVRRKSGQFRLETSQGTFQAGNLIVATDVRQAVRLATPLCLPVAAIQKIPYAPLAVLHFGFRRNDVEHPLNGLGVLVNQECGFHILGAIFSSTLFEGRVPRDRVLLTVFVGGMLQPDRLSLSDEELFDTTCNELSLLLGIRGQPVFQKMTRWNRALPQYHREQQAMLMVCRQAEESVPGFHLLGSYREGVSMAECLAKGHLLALKLAG